jgi:hypothetical protein
MASSSYEEEEVEDEVKENVEVEIELIDSKGEKVN